MIVVTIAVIIMVMVMIIRLNTFIVGSAGEISRVSRYRHAIGYCGSARKARLLRIWAEQAGHETLQLSMAHTARTVTVDALEVLAGCAADADSWAEAARLMGAAHAIRDHIGYRRCVSERDADIDTTGGLVFTLAGRVPTRGEVIGHPSGVEFRVLEADARRIRRLRVRRAAAESQSAA